MIIEVETSILTKYFYAGNNVNMALLKFENKMFILVFWCIPDNNPPPKKKIP